MFKGALLTATLVVAVSTPMAANVELEPGATPASDAPCRPVQSMDLACTMRVVDANGDGTVSAAELASFTAPTAPVIDLAPHAAGLSFKEVATESVLPAPATLEPNGPQRLIPALFALGAMVVLLRRRPT